MGLEGLDGCVQCQRKSEITATGQHKNWQTFSVKGQAVNISGFATIRSVLQPLNSAHATIMALS